MDVSKNLQYYLRYNLNAMFHGQKLLGGDKNKTRQDPNNSHAASLGFLNF